MTAAERFARLSTAAKLLLILTAVLLPIGIALAWIGETGIRSANAALEDRNVDQGRAAARAIESLVARNALALRIAANGALADGPAGACDRARRAVGVVVPRRRLATLARLLLLLPRLLWMVAAIIACLHVTRALVRPLRRLRHAVRDYRPREGPLERPINLGPSEEIQELRNAF